MRVMNKKWLGTAAAAALAGVMMIGGTFAFLTDKDSADNTFTVGNVDIEVQEPGYDEAVEKGETQNMVPLQTVAKDPSVEVKTEVPTIVFLKITVPKKNVSVADDDGNYGAEQYQEIFSLLTDGDEKFDPAWIRLTNCEDDAEQDYRTYIFGYSTVMSNQIDGGKTSEVFDAVRLKNLASSDNVGKNVDIKVDAYGIQASYVTGQGTDDIHKAGDSITNAVTLETIFNMYNANPEREYTASSSAGSDNAADNSNAGTDTNGSGNTDTTDSGSTDSTGDSQTPDPETNPDTNPSEGA